MQEGDNQARRRRGVRITVFVLAVAALAAYVGTFVANM
ncbi:hypothetical protein KBTX_03186 [wastewater metagenome]|uniref:Uncharacterized protein n=2 Tax=unclassified sequences TaxID=12908 RepID=A0A5B8RII7_9ZZZZ|nr:hypothetical protein KBTEX_03186 [uncultured organism]